MSGVTKHNILKGNSYYFGTPLRKVFRKRLIEYLQVTEEDLKRAESLKEELKKSKKKQSDFNNE